MDGSKLVSSSDRPQAIFHRMSYFSASAVCGSDRSCSSFSTSTDPTRSAQRRAARPRREQVRRELVREQLPPVLGQEREHAALREQVPGHVTGVPEIMISARDTLHDHNYPRNSNTLPAKPANKPVASYSAHS